VHPDLIETLRLAQRLGFFGERPIEQAVAHSQAFVEVLGDLPAGTCVADLGSGGGLPGLVLADAYPQASIVLVERRAKRADFLARAIRRLDFEHVEVFAGDAHTMVRQVSDRARPAFDVVTARGFGPPADTLGIARALLTATGRIAISEPPGADRWNPELLADLGVSAGEPGPVRVFRGFT